MPSPRVPALALALALLTVGLAPAAAGLEVSTKAIRVVGSTEYSQSSVQYYAGASQGSSEAFDGGGIGIAVLDTGVDNEHPTLENAFVAGAEVQSPCVEDDCVQDENPDGDASPNCFDPDDMDGHGTHVASTALGRGTDGGPRGVAPGASLIDVKVTDSLGGASLEDVRRGIEWVLEYNRGEAPCAASPPVHVIVLSLGTASPQDEREYDEAMEAVRKAHEAGVLVVAAAGNCGPEPENGALSCPDEYGSEDTVVSPAATPEAIAVGAVDDQDTARRAGDEIAPYSSRGPNPAEDASDERWRKPDLVAPGTGIEAACAATGPTGDASDNDVDCHLNGTSMATPHVAGVAALLRGAHDAVRDGAPLGPGQLTDLLTRTAGDLGPQGWDKDHGYGYVDAFDAIVEAVNRPPTSEFTFSPSEPAAGETVTFDASPTVDPDGDGLARFHWTFPGAEPTTRATTVDRVFDEPGTYEVELAAVDEYGTVDPNPVTRTVEVAEPVDQDENDRPEASLTLEPRTPYANRTATLSAAGSSDPDGDALVEYRWDIDAGEAFEADRVSTDPRIDVTVEEPGAHTFAVEVADERGATDTASLTVTVDPEPVDPPEVNITTPQEGGAVEAGELLASWLVENEVDEFVVYLDGVEESRPEERRLSLDLDPGDHTLRVDAIGPGGEATDWVNVTATEPADPAPEDPGNGSQGDLDPAEADDGNGTEGPAEADAEDQADAPGPGALVAATLAALAAAARRRAR